MAPEASQGEIVRLEGKVVVVTGASRGIGRAYVQALSAAGATVAALARTMEPRGGPAGSAATRGLASLIAPARAGRGAIHAFPCDLLREDDVVRVAADVVATLGGVDALVNNAALYPHHDSLAVSGADWDRELSVNVRAPYLTIRELAPSMTARGGGSVVNITSRSSRATGKVADATAHNGLLVYGVTKAGLERLTTYMAEELWAANVAVNAMSPGGVLTDTWREVAPEDFEEARRSGLGKLPVPEVVGPPVVYLAAQTAVTLTGQILHADTFRTLWAQR